MSSSLQKDLIRSDSSSSSSNQDLDDIFIDHTDLEALDDVAPQKRHFLDYDAVAPPGFEENFSAILTIGGGGGPQGSSSSQQKVSSSASSGLGENLKIDKKYERDGEISDYELAASGYTKKEFTQDDNTLVVVRSSGVGCVSSSSAFGKKKHFLDENPIPPDYMMLDKDMREHRSLDRNFERQHDFQRSSSGSSGRKHSLDRERDSRGSTRKYKEPSYTLSRFIESDLVMPPIESSLAWAATAEERNDGSQYSGLPKAECVYSLASMLGSHDSVDVSKKFLDLSRTSEACVALRKSGCIPLLVQMMHSDANDGVRKYAGMALHNVVHSHPDDKVGRREAKVLRLIEQILDYCNFLKTLLQSGGEAIADDSDRHPLAAISSLMKVSFDEEHRHAMCQLGALQAIAGLVHLDHAVHGPKPEDECCNSLRRYALMALTNLTFGDENNKTLLCGNKEFMEALVAQLDSAPDDLLQVTASVLRNLSWRVDSNMKAVLNEIGTVTALARAAMINKNENTLKAILSALWNLSAHCSTNKAEFCAVQGALAFLVDMLTYEGPSKTLKIIENAGGILRNVSSHIAVREDYRKILRERNCLAILLQQLKSESLTVVSNSCGTLWNLSARSAEDQKFLWDNGAVPMLRSLIHSKHKLISEGSSAALKNLQNFRPSILNQNSMDPIARSMGLKELPTLNARKQKALEQELVNQNLSETCENIDVVTPPKERNDFTPLTDPRKFPPPPVRLTRSAVVSKSESRDSIFSAKSDSAYEMMRGGNSAMNRGKMPPDRTIEFTVKTAAFDVENETEQPIDYSAKYSESATSKPSKSLADTAPKANQSSKGIKTARNYSSYQETDLDQLTDFSLRYAENQVESDIEEKTRLNNGGEIILILEDSVKCYQTEDTPYVISNAASVSDLQNPKLEENVAPNKPSVTSVIPSNNVIYGCGSYTPEKPINYCEEGTPGCFSRYESLSSLEESPQNAQTSGTASGKTKSDKTTDGSGVKQTAEKSPDTAAASASVDVKEEEKATLPENAQESGTAMMSKNSYNSAQETPLMFSRHSSMDSLAEEEEVEAIVADDKDSVVSDFSRLASGIISPSEIPDSPTQSMPQSPRRNSNSQLPFSEGEEAALASGCSKNQHDPPPRLRSVFEDDLNTFQVENTPAQFSCATSLSNLSLDDEQPTDKLDIDLLKTERPRTNGGANDQKGIDKPSKLMHVALSEGEEETNDDYLLATCINIGMNRDRKDTKVHKGSVINVSAAPLGDSTMQYYTEDTPAVLSKVGSNSNLSAISMLTNPTDIKNDSESLANLSDDISSNASEAGHDLLQQCINVGIEAKIANKRKNNVTSTEAANALTNNCPLGRKGTTTATRKKLVENATNDPIAMLRRGGLPMHTFSLPVNDEMNKYLVEDSPCNFSMISGLSNLTIGSNIAGPALMKKSPSGGDDYRSGDINESKKMQQPQMQQHQSNIADDSLSSLSIESEDDTNLLSLAIAAGCNRSKSNLGFSSTNNRPLSTSQPIPTSSSLAINQNLSTNHQKIFDGNESISSIDSSDSNDNHSKSLFEQCIRTGMNKKTRSHSEKQQPPRSSTSNPNLNLAAKLSQLSSIPRVPNPKSPLRLDRERQRDRERKDEQLLQECISTGMAITAGANQIKPPTRHTRHMISSVDTLFNQRRTNDQHHPPQFPPSFAAPRMQSPSPIVINTMSPTTMPQKIPKNGETTSAAVLEQSQHRGITISQSAPNTAPGVEMNEYPEGTKDPGNLQDQQLTAAERVEEAALIRDSSLPMTIGSSTNSAETGGGGAAESTLLASMNTTWTDEYAGQEMVSSQDSFQESQSVSFDMDSSSHQQTPIVANKHKDPDLMLKSVERLTHDYVSTAEYLRAADNSDLTDGATGCNNKYNNNNTTTTTTSNNTWSEDTCPNDVSFPSVSISAPMIASFQDDDDDDQTSMQLDHSSFHFKGDLHDFAEITPTNEVQQFESLSMQTMNTVEEVGTSQPNSLETETDTLVNDELTAIVSENEQFTELTSEGIRFQVGGEVKRVPLQSASTNNYLAPGFGVPSVMTNSTIIALEANRLADNLLNDMTLSTNSLDLDNIRPPSCMETLSMSGCYEVPQSPQMSRMRKKSLPAGIVARRALGHLPSALNGSLESVNSSCNLDNIKPPSLMDELLDSMISVSSIQSEIVDHSLNNTTMSNYETAYDFDENTITLHSCSDTLPRDGYDSNETPQQSDFSSAESTPRKYRNVNGVKRALTPKQKRKLVKDRFKTYTIAADFALNENYSGELQELDFDGDDDEVLQIEIEEIEDLAAENGELTGGHVLKKSPSAIQKRNANPDRYRTRTISYACDKELNNCDIQSIGASNDQESLTSTDDCSEEMSSIKAMTKHFKFIASSDLATEYNHTDLEEGCSMQTVVIARSTATTIESDYNSMECDQTSETESCYQNNYHNEEKEKSPPKRLIRPRIVKLGDKDSGTEVNFSEDGLTPPESVVKAVRGRKKPQYISPYRKTARSSFPSKAQISNITNIAVNKTSQLKKLPVTSIKQKISKPGSGVAALDKKSNVPSKLGSIQPSAAPNKKSNQVVPPTPPAVATPPTLERQGTFVQDEPTITDVPVPVVDVVISPTRASKLPLKKSIATKLKPPSSKVAPTVVGKLPRQITMPARPHTAASSTSIDIKRKGLIGVRKSPSVPTVPQRSNSNASIRVTPSIQSLRSNLPSTTPPSRSNSNLTTATKINQISSRIAGIWKKVDEAKRTASKTTATPLAKQTTTTTVPTTKPSQLRSAGKLNRSSTFDNSPSVEGSKTPVVATGSKGASHLHHISPTKRIPVTVSPRKRFD